MSSAVLRRTPFLLVVAMLLATLAPLGTAGAADPAEGSVSAANPEVTWTGGPLAVSDPVTDGCTPDNPACDFFTLTVDTGGAAMDLAVHVVSSDVGADIDLFVYDADGTELGSSASAGADEKFTVERVSDGAYTVATKAFTATPDSVYAGDAQLKPRAGASVAAENAPETAWPWDEDAPQLTAEVPLRVVMVGFNEDDPRDQFTAEEIFREIPNNQRVGSLFKYGGGDGSGSTTDFFGLDTLVNHGRGYYDTSTPFLLPIEYRWKPELHYARSDFSDELFATMVENSHMSDPATEQKDYLESYNSDRGTPYRVQASGDPSQAVPPGAPVRYIEAEAVEDWVAENTGDHFDFSTTNEFSNTGYTVYVLNTWDAPVAYENFPAGEYHNWWIPRTDPDDGSFDGIDWGRVWGGRYRFMMIDLGAAPNAYEEETWGGGVSQQGSALYDPPMWEYRAEAPRQTSAEHAADGTEQAVAPGEFWDRDQLAYILGRSVNQAVNFRFFHSYLYEPRPGTGRFYLSDNVWHDATAELPYPTQLESLYDQEVALEGLRSLTPYFDFDGDVVFEYLASPPAGSEDDYSDDQGMLDQAKQDGDDIVGAAHVSMHTETAMDYLDGNPPRFLRGGACATTVPTISVVVPGVYAWALPIAAGIATNRDGVPWGFLASVNDLTKWDGSDREGSASNLYHVNPRFSGSFTYTVVHEASHYLGLAHPHDTIGAVRNEDGSPRYYDGFTWMYNSTASPTTYSHVELEYGILDQESIARGHSSYYMTWTDQALAEVGSVWAEEGKLTLAQIDPELVALRDKAIAGIQRTEKRFAAFDFVQAAFDGQVAWRSAATLRDRVLGLESGTSEFEKKTGLGVGDAAKACADASANQVENAPVPTPVKGPSIGQTGGPLPTTGGGALPLGLTVLALAGAIQHTVRRRRFSIG